MKPAEPIALVDMDSTLCNFDGALRRDMTALASPQELLDPNFEANCANEDLPWVKARRDLIKRQPGWWRNLEKFQLGFDVLETLKILGYQVHVLTKGPYKTTPAWTEKVDWCREHIPGVPVTISEDKGLVYGRVLVDDWPPYVTRWLEWRPRGLVIMPTHPWNKDFRHENVIHYDGNNMATVMYALRKQIDARE